MSRPSPLSKPIATANASSTKSSATATAAAGAITADFATTNNKNKAVGGTTATSNSQQPSPAIIKQQQQQQQQIRNNSTANNNTAVDTTIIGSHNSGSGGGGGAELVAAVSSPMTMRRLANSKVVSKRDAGIINRPSDDVPSSDDMTFSSSASSEMEDDRGGSAQRHHHHRIQQLQQHRQAGKKLKTTTPGAVGKSTTSSNSHLTAGGSAGGGARIHNLLSVGVGAGVSSTTDDLSSDYFADNFPSLKHAISKLSTAASLGSSSDSMRDDDFDDEDFASNSEVDQTAPRSQFDTTNSNNSNELPRPATRHQSLGMSFGTGDRGGGDDANAGANLSLVDEMTNMHVNAVERRMILTPEKSETAMMAGAYPSAAKRGSLSLTQKQKCMSVSNVSTIEQQMAYGFPSESGDDTTFYPDEVQALRMMAAAPRKSAIDVCYDQSNNANNILRPASCHPNLSPSDSQRSGSSPDEPLSPMNSVPSSSSTQTTKQRPERTKSYTATQLTVPKILFS